MSELLPVHMDHTTHPYLMRLVMAYRPFQELYIDTELTPDDIKNRTHVGIRELTKDIGLEYNDEIKRRS